VPATEQGTETGAAHSGPAKPWRRHRTRRRPTAIPDLPPKLEQFQALVRLAFGVARPDPQDETLISMLDTLAAFLWERLHVFEAVVEQEEERFEPDTQDGRRAAPRQRGHRGPLPLHRHAAGGGPGSEGDAVT